MDNTGLAQTVVNTLFGFIGSIIQIAFQLIGVILGAFVSLCLAMLNLPGVPEALVIFIAISASVIAIIKKRSHSFSI